MIGNKQVRDEVRIATEGRSNYQNVSLISQLMKFAQSANGVDSTTTWKYIWALEERITQPGMLSI